MRIVAGEFRSRVLTPLKGDQTRPTADKIKEAVFSSIGPYFSGGVMLDAYAGSGNISFEALSRGMAESVLCDISAAAIRTIRSNAALLQVEARCQIYKRDVFAMLDVFVQQGLRFDLVCIVSLQEALVTKGLLAEQADVIVESLREESFAPAHGDLIRRRESVYGITKITYYRRSL